ncbi:33 kDa chaperonin [Rickettsiales bacterium Ac37b]|nr:33 kDa chaperonin [Rickettsiales bacterium Ac37b]
MSTILPFLFKNTPIRGRICRVNSVVDQIIKQHNYPPLISHLLAEATIITVILASINNKSEQNTTTLQIKSDGPISLLTVDCFNQNKIRGYVGYDPHSYKKLIENETNPRLSELFTNGYLAITLNHNLPNRYQGIVDLQLETITACIENYFLQSEQIDTSLVVSTGQNYLKTGMQWCGGGIIIQKLPSEQNQIFALDNLWEEIKILTETVKIDELIDPILPKEDLLYRLYNQHEVLLFPEQNFIFECRCSREKAQSIFNTIPYEELDSFKIDDYIEIKCEFCGKKEIFYDHEHSGTNN